MPTQSFDLSSSAESYEASGIRPRRILLAVTMGIGVLASAGGAFDLATGSAAYSGLLFVGAGVAVLIASGAGFRVLPRAAAGIEVTGTHLRFRRLDGRTFELSWDDPRLRLEIRDWTSIPADKRSKGLDWVEFIVSPNAPVEAAVNRPTVLALLSAASAHGFEALGWSGSPPPAGRARLIRLVRARPS